MCASKTEGLISIQNEGFGVEVHFESDELRCEHECDEEMGCSIVSFWSFMLDFRILR